MTTPSPLLLETSPPRRSKITGSLAALACAACCAIPILIAAGLITGAGAALLQQTLLAVAAALTVLALGMWWLHRRRASKASQALTAHAPANPKTTQAVTVNQSRRGCGKRVSRQIRVDCQA